MKKILILSKDKYFCEKIRILAKRAGVEASVGEADLPSLHDHISAVFLDADTIDTSVKETVYRFSRTPREGYEPIPFPNERIASLLTQKDGDGTLRLSAEERTVSLYDRIIHLTEVEYAILSSLIDARGETVSAEALLSEGFHKEAGIGAVNVYIHYLREKLEFRGEKIIRATRGIGYRIEKKFIKEAH